MLTTIKFRNIPTIAFSQKYNAKIFYDVDIRDSIVNILEFRILKSGDINFQPIIQTINYNGEYIKITPEVPARLFANAGYQISARVGLNSAGAIEWGPWSEWESFRIELTPTIYHNLIPVGGGFKANNQTFDATINYNQIQNDVLVQYRYKLYEILTNEILQQGEWQYLEGFPTEGGLIKVKTVPNTSFTLNIAYSYSNNISMTIFPSIGTWTTLDEVVFDMAEAISQYTDLAFEILPDDPSTLKIKSRRQVIGVNISTSLSSTFIETSNLTQPFPKERFYNLEMGKQYKYEVEMVSLRGLKTRYFSPIFTIDYSLSDINAYADIDIINLNNGSAEIIVENLIVETEDVNLLPNEIIIARKKIGVIENNCLSTNQIDYILDSPILEISSKYLEPQAESGTDTYYYYTLRFIDNLLEDGADYEYIVLLKNNNIVKQVNLLDDNTLYSQFEGTYIGDKENRFHFILNSSIGSVEYKVSNGVLEPLENQYPISSYGELNYRSGSFSAIIISGQQAQSSISINKGREIELKKIFIEWLTNGQPKILQLESGELIIISITGNPKLTKDVTFIDVVDFSWVESAEINSVNLRNLRLSEFYYGTMYYEDEFLEVN